MGIESVDEINFRLLLLQLLPLNSQSFDFGKNVIDILLGICKILRIVQLSNSIIVWLAWVDYDSWFYWIFGYRLCLWCHSCCRLSYFLLGWNGHDLRAAAARHWWIWLWVNQLAPGTIGRWAHACTVAASETRSTTSRLAACLAGFLFANWIAIILILGADSYTAVETAWAVEETVALAS